jgi:hypothetical protein
MPPKRAEGGEREKMPTVPFLSRPVRSIWPHLLNVKEETTMPWHGPFEIYEVDDRPRDITASFVRAIEHRGQTYGNISQTIKILIQDFPSDV